jgi:hypothetical protein
VLTNFNNMKRFIIGLIGCACIALASETQEEKMTPEKQRIAIAEACGATWRQLPELNTKVLSFCHGANTLGPLRWELENGDILAPDIPDYLSDLNAMHEAEKVLGNAQNPYAAKWLQYLTILQNICGDVPSTFATAAQRAEAFLHTLNLWTE